MYSFMSQKVVHHMILYATTDDLSGSGTFDCSSMPKGSSPLFLWVCGHLVAKIPRLWAVANLNLQQMSDLRSEKEMQFMQPFRSTTTTQESRVASLMLLELLCIFSQFNSLIYQRTHFQTPANWCRLFPVGSQDQGNLHSSRKKLLWRYHRNFYWKFKFSSLVSATCPASKTKGLKKASEVNPLTPDYVVFASGKN